MADDKEREAQRKRIREQIAAIYADGFSSGMTNVANEYGMHSLIPQAGLTLSEPLTLRMSYADKAVDTYLEMVARKYADLREQGLSDAETYAKLLEYSRDLANDKSELIVEMERATGEIEGAKAIMDESGVEYEWRFPHYDLGAAHEECPICEAIRERSPYSSAEAEAEGFPSLPHPYC